MSWRRSSRPSSNLSDRCPLAALPEEGDFFAPAEVTGLERRVSDTENKLMLLYVLRALGEADDLELLRFVSEGGWMNYFSLRLGLGELLDSGEVAQDTDGQYAVTPEGLRTIEGFARRVPASRRAEADALAAVWRRQLRDERSLPSESYLQPDGRVLLRLSVMDREEELMRVLLLAPARPDRLAQRWHAVGQDVYREVLQALFAHAAPGPLPEGCSAEDLGGQTLLLLGEGEAFSLALTLPEAETARSLAAAWPALREELRERVWKAVTNANIF